jgi:YVTN family beta-propeller protein
VRRALALLLLLAVSPAAAAKPWPRGAGKVGYKVSLGGSTFVIWQAVEAGAMPKGASVSHDGKRLFVTNFGRRSGKNIAVYSAGDPLKLERYVSYEGNAIESALSPDDRWLYATNKAGDSEGELAVIDLRKGELARRIPVKGFPKVIELDARGKLAYVSLWSERALARLELATGKLDKLKYGKLPPRGLALSRDGKLLFAANNMGRTVTVVDTEKFAVKQHITVPGSPRHVVLSHDGKRVYVSAMGKGSLAVIDVATLKVQRYLKIGERPKTIDESRDGRFVYSANYTGHSMSIVDTRDWKVRELPLDVYKTSGLAVHPNDKYIYITSWCSDEVFVVRRFDDGQPLERPTAKHPQRHLCRECPSPLMDCPPGKELYGPPPKKTAP